MAELKEITINDIFGLDSSASLEERVAILESLMWGGESTSSGNSSSGSSILSDSSLGDRITTLERSIATHSHDDRNSSIISSTMRSANFQSGNNGWEIKDNGDVEFNNGVFRGSLTASTIDIGGADATSFHVDINGNIWSGDALFASAPFKVSNAGVLNAVSGTIGGCVLSTTSIGSSTFVSGPLGVGWNISNTGVVEFQNATIRGMIRTSVFEKDTISAVNGMVLVSSADVLSADMTALDASTLTISGQTTFSVNEVVRIKDGVNDEWMLVTNATSAPIYTVTRDLAGSYATNTNPIWKKGTAVVSMGVGTGTKTGFMLLDSTSTNSPYMDIYGRNSNTYTDYTLHGRFGWLKGITDSDVGLADTDVWGLYTDSAYIKGTIFSTSGTIGGFTIDSFELYSNYGGVERISLQSDTGTIVSGNTVSGPYISIAGASPDISYFNSSGALLGSLTKDSNNTALLLNGNVSGYIQKMCTAGESIVPGGAVYMENATTTDTMWLSGSGATDTLDFGYLTATNTQKVGLEFDADDTVRCTQVMLSLKKVGSPTDQIKVDIYKGNPNESTTPILTQYVDYTELTTDFSTIILDIDYVFSIAGGTGWSVVLSRTGTHSDTNLFACAVKLGGGSYGFWYLNNTGWHSGGNAVPYLRIDYTITEVGRVYKTDANVTGKYEQFIGFAKQTGTASDGESIPVAVNGVVTLSGLTTGEYYYLSDTPGLISTTPGTNTRKVGIATSATELLITNIW